jgi:probable addiction module antidote protein
MPKKTQSYRAWQMEKLADPKHSANYLNSALQDSTEAFLVAVGKVLQARQISKVAKDAGVQRETLYRSFSEQGNPTLDTLTAVLKAVGLSIVIGTADTNPQQPRP